MLAKFFYDDLVESNNPSISVTSEATGYKKEYMFDNTALTKYRTTGISNEIFYFEFDVNLAVAVIEFHGTNLVAGDIFKIDAGSTTACNEETEITLTDTDIENGYKVLGWNQKIFKLTISKVSGSYIEIGIIILYGNNYGFERNYNWKYQGGYEKKSNREEGYLGQIDKKKKFKRKIYSLQFTGLRNAQAELFDETIRDYDFITFYDPEKDKIYFGEIDFSIPVHQNGNFWNMNAIFTEAK